MQYSQLKLTESGTIDLHYYQRQAKRARAEAISAMLQQLKQWLAARLTRRSGGAANLRPAH